MSADISQVERIQAAMRRTVRAHWGMFLAEGIILLILGIGAVVLPPVATVAVEIIFGWLLLVSGIVGLLSTFWMRGAAGFWWSLLSAVIALTAGIVLLRWPLSGALSLTLVLTAFLSVEGVASILYALDHKRDLSGRWGMMLASGIIDLFLAGMIFLGLPSTAVWAIGLLVGVNLIVGGAALIAMALHARKPLAA
jgi:uncharacterized membrane protein HdeD (DUF308 family)